MSIKINVSGTIFETTKTTILKINYFKYLLEDSNLDLNITIPFVDRPAHIFKHVLALAQDDIYPYPIKYKSELDFYDVVYDVGKLYNPIEDKLIKYIDKKLNNITSLMSNSYKTPGICKRYNCNLSEYTTHNTYGFCYEHWKSCDYIDPNNNTYCNKYSSKFFGLGYRCMSHIGNNIESKDIIHIEKINSIRYGMS